MKIKSLMAGVGAAAALVLAGSAASAATVINLGHLTASGLSYSSTTTSPNQSYQLTFDVVAPLNLDADGVSSNSASVTKYFSGGTVQFFHNSGTATAPTNGGGIGAPTTYDVFTGAGGKKIGEADTPTYHLAAGQYYLEMDPTGPSGTKFTTSISAFVPEPATWALTMMGLLAAGAMLRRQRKTQVGMALA